MAGFGFSRNIPIATEGGGPGGRNGGTRAEGIGPQEAVRILSVRQPERPVPAPSPLATFGQGSGQTGDWLAQAFGLGPMVEGLAEAFRRPGAVPLFGLPERGRINVSGDVGRGSLFPGSSPSPAPQPTIKFGQDPNAPGGTPEPAPEPLPIPTPPQAAASPFAQPGRNPRLAEKYGWDIDTGQPLF